MQIDSSRSTDAPLMGNIDSMTFILGKNEVGSLKDGKVRAMGRRNVSIPEMAGWDPKRD